MTPHAADRALDRMARIGSAALRQPPLDQAVQEGIDLGVEGGWRVGDAIADAADEDLARRRTFQETPDERADLVDPAVFARIQVQQRAPGTPGDLAKDRLLTSMQPDRQVRLAAIPAGAGRVAPIVISVPTPCEPSNHA